MRHLAEYSCVVPFNEGWKAINISCTIPGAQKRCKLGGCDTGSLHHHMPVSRPAVFCITTCRFHSILYCCTRSTSCSILSCYTRSTSCSIEYCCTRSTSCSIEYCCTRSTSCSILYCCTRSTSCSILYCCTRSTSCSILSCYTRSTSCSIEYCCTRSTSCSIEYCCTRSTSCSIQYCCTRSTSRDTWKYDFNLQQQMPNSSQPVASLIFKKTAMSGTGSIFNLSKNNQKNRDKKSTEPSITCHQCKISVRNTVAKVYRSRQTLQFCSSNCHMSWMRQNNTNNTTANTLSPTSPLFRKY
ncbi:hypothetical protein ACHWQZ_G009460 [Mnemiopsis leidyi]